MNWRQRILTDWPNDPQRSHKCRTALQQIEEGLTVLATMGHPLHVEEGYAPPPPPEWPRVMFHLFQGAKVFYCEADVTEAGEDWYPTMEEARYAAGVTKQNQRGGIFSKALPSIPYRTSDQKSHEKAVEEEAERLALQVKRQFIEDQRALHRSRAGEPNFGRENGLARQV